MLLWGMLGTAFFLRGLTSTRLRYWVLYVLAMFLAIATILYSFFIVAGHALAFVAACWMLRRQGKPMRPLAIRAVAAWAVLGILSFHLYASSLPQVYVLMQNLYHDPAGGYAPISLEYLQEMIRGLSVGLGGTLGSRDALYVFVHPYRASNRARHCYALVFSSGWLPSPRPSWLPFVGLSNGW